MNKASIQKLTISQAAKLFSVSKKTLMRWDSSGTIKAYREPLTNLRYYIESEIKWQAYWYRLRLKHRAHNRKLTAIRKEVDKFLTTIPLSKYQNPNEFTIEATKDMTVAYSTLQKWEEEDKAIMSEYSKLPSDFTPRIDSP